MALFVFITKACRAEAERHGYQNTLDRFCERVEKSQDTRNFDPFPAHYIVKKQFGARQGRLIAEKHSIQHLGEDHTVVVFVSVMIRGEHAYDAEFSRGAIEYGQRHFRGLFTQEELVSFVSDRVGKNPVVEKQRPTEAEYSFLYQVQGRNENMGDNVVYESADWVRLMQETPFKNWHSSIYQSVSEDLGAAVHGAEYRKVSGKPGWVVLIRRLPEHKALFLVAPLENSTGAQADVMQKKYGSLLSDNQVTTKMMLSKSKRAYPEIVLADGDLWLELQKEQLGNLALSPEETEIMERAKAPRGSFPLFINGRAGSGKSTILQYLFTDYLLYHLETRGIPSPPVYFTCSSMLLANARRVVESLIRCGGQYWHTDRQTALKDATPILDAAFREFHGHLLSLVSPQVRTERFGQEKYINYAKFRSLWLRKFSQNRQVMRDYSADLCWHVIRTYIKGASPDALLDPEEYRQIEQKQRSVSQEAYDWIYTNVWDRWYKELSESEEYWDDQDLARYLLESELIKPVYPAIFCDEAQDFTRLELEIILRMSIFSERKLAPSELPLVPFLFAGDQFQTLNPTGFRWDAIKAWFVEKFIFALDPNRKSGLEDINYQELTFNYRSTRPIVRFSNFVQALRVRLFEVNGVRPQTPWDDSPGSPVMFFDREDANFWEALKKFSDVVFVLPCAEGEELEFLKSDPILGKRIKFEEGVPSMPVLSAARAKGLEFNRVVVYGFGEAAEERLLTPLKGGEPHTSDPDAALPLEYYINRLYVSISRPKRQLLIVDTKQGSAKLWNFAGNAEFEAAILEGIKNGKSIWGQHIERPEIGRVDQIDTSIPVNIIENAETMEREGLARQDSYMLRQAAVSFKNAGEEDRSIKCRATAEKIDQSFLSAGKLFLQIGQIEPAIECYWSAGEEGWPRILEAVGTHPQILSRLEYAFADFLTGTKPFAVGHRTLVRLQESLGADIDKSINLSSVPWIKAVEKATEKLLSSTLNSAATAGEWNEIDKALSFFEDKGIRVNIAVRAKVAFKATNYQLAAKLWESTGKTELQDYKKAKAESTPYPARLSALNELELWSRIIEEWKEHLDVVLQGDSLGPVTIALARTGKLMEARTLALASRHLPSLLTILKIAEESRQPNIRDELNPIVAVLLIQAEKWDTVRQLMDKVESAKSSTAVALVRAFARSEAITQLPSEGKSGPVNQSNISDFLRRWYGVHKPGEFSPGFLSEVGAAIERAGKRVDALKYYETLMVSAEQTISQPAAIRWIVCKERQAANDLKRGDERPARDRKNEANEARRKHGIPQSQAFPEFPELTTFGVLLDELSKAKPNIEAVEIERAPEPIVVPTVEPSAAKDVEKKVAPALDGIHVPTEVLIRPYQFTFFHNTTRLNITHLETGESASFRDQGAQVSGDWVLVAKASSPHEFNSEKLPFLVTCEKSGFAIHFKLDRLQLIFSTPNDAPKT